MPTRLLPLALAVICAALAACALPFTYQGRLLKGGGPPAATMDLRFTLYAGETGDKSTGDPVVLEDVPVANGLFTVTLDFGNAFDMDGRWLEIAARPGDETGSYTVLAPRQPVHWAPRATFAAAVPWSGVTGAPAFWRLAGNAGTGAGDFLGTTDAQPLRLKVNNTLAWRLEPPPAGHETDLPNIIGGYSGNSAGANAVGGVIAGGGSATYPNSIDHPYATVSGGEGNSAITFATVVGGFGNVANGMCGIAGGLTCTAGEDAVALGVLNTAGGYGSVALGRDNVASGAYAVALGDSNHASGGHSFALGRWTDADGHRGVFLWGDDSSSYTQLFATADNQFTVRAAGGVRLFTADDLSAGVTLAAGGSAWNVVSDRHAKTRFAAVDTRDILRKVAALPLTSWSYKAQAPAYRHLGPMAQDFAVAFGLGEGDDRVINTLDLDGVALAAIQGLEKELAAVKAENAALRDRLADLAKRVEAMEQPQ